MNSQPECPLLDHDLDSPSAFTPGDLVSAVRAAKDLPDVTVPLICVLDFDGDLTDWLVRRRLAAPFEPWACFHTTMYVLESDGVRCGIVARTIGGPYAVLIAEQLHVSGARLILGLTSAGRVSPSLPLPSFVVVTCAVRDEGTSFHYLPPAGQVCCPTPIADLLTEEMRQLGPAVVQGSVWTTDAPYRETAPQLQRHAAAGVLAVEMQAASLFAFATARKAGAGVVAHVTNAVDHPDEQFDKGTDEDSYLLLRAMLRAGRRFLKT
ncbi:MAG: nucleoside phosphorylase [Acidobacteria bacterium]|nr:nucleoside phosphorylase [Acidobacteriota bacterium]